MYQTLNLTPGQRVEFNEQFDFIRVMESPASLALEFFRDGRKINEAWGVGAGFSETFEQPCGRLVVTNGATAQDVTIAARMGSRVAFDKPPTGQVSVAGTVQIADSRKDTSLSGKAFSMALYSPSSAQCARHYLANPAGSGKDMIVSQLVIGADGANWMVVSNPRPVVPSGSLFNTSSKNGLGACVGVMFAVLGGPSNFPGASDGGGGYYMSAKIVGITSAKDTKVITFTEPMVVKPGYAIEVGCMTPNQATFSSFEWTEQ